MKRLKGKKVMITGGSVGIGFAIAKAFVKKRAEVLTISGAMDFFDKVLGLGTIQIDYWCHGKC